MNNVVGVKNIESRKVKCQICELLDSKGLMVQEINKKYYHTIECHQKYLDAVQLKKTEGKQFELLIAKITEIHKLANSSHLPHAFIRDIGALRDKFNHPNFLDGLLEGYIACQEKIDNARNNKEFLQIQHELRYGLSIVRAWMSNKLNNYKLERNNSEVSEFELTEEQKIDLKSYKIESPIEEKILITLLYNNHDQDKDYIEVSTQKEFEINKRKYRVDFIIKSKKRNKEYIIECDGHDFHEITKEQASRDKQRDRDFLTINIPTVRFSGSEIWNNSKTCVEEIMLIIKN